MSDLNFEPPGEEIVAFVLHAGGQVHEDAGMTYRGSGLYESQTSWTGQVAWACASARPAGVDREDGIPTV